MLVSVNYEQDQLWSPAWSTKRTSHARQRELRTGPVMVTSVDYEQDQLCSSAWITNRTSYFPQRGLRTAPVMFLSVDYEQDQLCSSAWIANRTSYVPRPGLRGSQALRIWQCDTNASIIWHTRIHNMRHTHPQYDTQASTIWHTCIHNMTHTHPQCETHASNTLKIRWIIFWQYTLWCNNTHFNATIHSGVHQYTQWFRQRLLLCVWFLTRSRIMGYKLSYTTGSLYAWASCMQWGVWVWTVGHGCPGSDNILFQRRMSSFLKRTNCIPERRSRVTATVVSQIFP